MKAHKKMIIVQCRIQETIVNAVSNKFFVCILLIAYCSSAKAQLRTTALGASAALNGTAVMTTPVSAISPATIAQVPVIPAKSTTVPVAGLQNPAMNVGDILNSKDTRISYQSAYSWWQGYQDYKNAASGMQFNGDGSQVQAGPYGVFLPVTNELRSAIDFFLDDAHFTLFRDYGNHKMTLLLRGNQPIPVELMPDPGGYITYSPQLTGFSTTVPLNLK